MKNKIAVKFFLSFAAALLIFSLIVGSGFAYLFRKHVVMVKVNDMRLRAERISQALGESRDQWLDFQVRRRALQEEKGKKTPGYLKNVPLVGSGHKALGFNSVLRFLGSSAAEDVWIIDENHHLEITGNNRESKSPAFLYKDLPEEATSIVQQVLQGENSTSQGFSNLLEVPTLTVGTPVRDKDNNIIGAVLIHAPISGLDSAVLDANRILLMCGGVALFIAFLVALYFAWRFTKPLKIMQQTAEEMTEGDYSARCNLKQQDEIGELATALDSLGSRLLVASEESAKLDKLRKDFIANISHELRTPVTVIRGSLEALVDKVVTAPAKVEEYYGQMLSETLFLQRLINDLLDLSRLQNTDFKIEMSPVNICEILQDVARSGQRLGKDKNINVTFRGDVPYYVLEGDYGRLRQMLLVFVDNGIKFSPENSTIEIALAGQQLTVTDHGCGVSAEALPHIFDRFYKTRNEKNKTGTGLGLAIAREIAERHGMDVHMESIPEKATKVVLDLPAPEKVENNE